MNSAQGSSRSTSRKPTRTYSLTFNGSSYSFTSLRPSLPSLPTSVVVAAPPPSSSSIPPPVECHTHTPTASFSNGSNARLYKPYIPVPRGPRSTNLYLYPPTKEDYAKARRRSIVKAAAIEDALKERADDERRRDESLGIIGPRKSTRNVKSKSNLAAEHDVSTAQGKTASGIGAKRGRKGRRAAKPAVPTEPQAAMGDSSISPSGSSIPVQPPSDGYLLSKGSRRKPRPMVNLRPTPRLTTRSLAKTRASSLRDGDSAVGNTTITPSETGEDVTIEDHRDTGDLALPEASNRDVQPMVVDSDPSEARSENSDHRANSSVDSSLPSSDTLYDDAESISLKVAVSHARTTVILPSWSRSSTSSTVPISSRVRSLSPPYIIPASLSSAEVPANQIGGKKRKQEQMDAASEIPPYTGPESLSSADIPANQPGGKRRKKEATSETPTEQRRRSARVPKPRTLQ